MSINLSAAGQNYQNQPLELVTVIYDRYIHPQFGYSAPVTLNTDYDNLAKAVVILAFNTATRSSRPAAPPGERSSSRNSKAGDGRKGSASSPSMAPAVGRSGWTKWTSPGLMDT